MLALLNFQFTLHSLFPSLRASMAKPQEAQRMAALVLSILAGTTIIFAAICYITFGPGMPEQVTTELGTGTIGLLANW
jgi:amino acid permease